MNNVDDLLSLVIGALVVATTLGRGIGASVNADFADGDLLAVALVGDIVDELEVVNVRDDLVAGELVLEDCQPLLPARKEGVVRVQQKRVGICKARGGAEQSRRGARQAVRVGD